jgi:DNA-binding response OmpR family regulator
MKTDTPPTVLIVEPDAGIRDLLADELGADGFVVVACGSLIEGRQRLPAAYPDVLIVNAELPDGSGLDLVSEVRSSLHGELVVDPDLPLVVLNKRCSESDRVRAFEYGADDILSTDFAYRELRGRLGALLRRRERQTRRGRIRVGQLDIDPIRHVVRISDRPLALTQKEFSLLQTLASEPSRVFTKDELLRMIWGYRSSGGSSTTRTLDSHACRLRAKLAQAGARQMVQNVWGVGYRLNAAAVPVAVSA